MASKRWASHEQALAFFENDMLGQAVFDMLARDIQRCGGAELRVAKTQLGWARRRGLALLWCPDRWLGKRAAPLVLTVALPRVDASPRWKQVVEVRPGLWNHHLEVRGVGEIDEEVLGHVEAAYDAAG